MPNRTKPSAASPQRAGASSWECREKCRRHLRCEFLEYTYGLRDITVPQSDQWSVIRCQFVVSHPFRTLREEGGHPPVYSGFEVAWVVEIGNEAGLCCAPSQLLLRLRA